MPDVFLVRAPAGAGGLQTWYFAICALVVAAGCFDPSYEEGIVCSEAQACPPGMVCDPLDNRCRYQPLPDPACDDGAHNGDETGEDCGGSCPACAAGQPCGQAGDCQSGVCVDSVCAAPACGDGVINQAIEVCDDGGESALCNADCTPVSCGDGVVNAAAGEDCDDGGETALCNGNCTVARCGDSIHNMSAGEVCDDGGESALCDADCTAVACGDGTTNMAASEQCDTTVNTASCDIDCTLALCGDSFVNSAASEQCDDGGETVTCDIDCTMVACGDGLRNATAGESCDTAGNSATCDSDCTDVVCGDSFTNPAANEDCDDGGETATCDIDCTVAECGDLLVNATAGEACDEGGVDTVTCDADCSANICGDLYRNPLTEDCDDGGDSPVCDADCTIAVCGDGYVNVVAGEQCDGGPTCNPDCTLVVVCGNGVLDPGEDCDLGAANDDHGRCGSRCFWGAGLDGTFGAAWQSLAPSSGILYALVSFHYSGTRYIHDFNSDQRYDVAANAWSPVPVASPFGSKLWADAAVATDSLWVPRNNAMYRYDLATATWTTVATGIPDGAAQYSAAVFDGEGYIWYHGPGNDLVRFDPRTNTALSITHSSASGYIYETRVAYDPVTNSVVFTGFLNNTFTIYDIDTGTFFLSSPSPGGNVHDNTCQDRSGNIYTGSTSYTEIYQYNVAADTWTVLGALPFSHDNNSTCVVSQDGYLYYASSSNFARIPLGVH